jgi:hypothetical protein
LFTFAVGTIVLNVLWCTSTIRYQLGDWLRTQYKHVEAIVHGSQQPIAGDAANPQPVQDNLKLYASRGLFRSIEVVEF